MVTPHVISFGLITTWIVYRLAWIPLDDLKMTVATHLLNNCTFPHLEQEPQFLEGGMMGRIHNKLEEKNTLNSIAPIDATILTIKEVSLMALRSVIYVHKKIAGGQTDFILHSFFGKNTSYQPLVAI